MKFFFKNDWEKVSRKFVNGGVYVNIITNAYNLGDEQFRQLKDSGIKQVAISVDGMENAHNTTRRNPHSFEHIQKAMKRFRDEGYFVSVVTTLTDLNFNDLKKMYQLFLDNKVEIWQLQLASPMGNASDNLELLIDPVKVPLITKFIKEKNKERKILIVAGDNVGYYDNNEHYIRGDLTEFQGCQAGKFVVGIDSIGNVKGCESLYSDEFIEGNLRKNSLYEIWNRDGAFAYNRNFKPSMLEGKCKGCNKADPCAGGCRQLSNFTSGNKFKSIYCCYK